MAYHLPNRWDSENTIKKLVELYPKCFVEEPRLRRPLKNNVIADLHAKGCPLAPELMAAGLAWYEGHYSYLYGLRAGTKRIDLNGNEAGTVTLQEQDEAVRRAIASQAARDDQLKRLDALPMLRSTATARPLLNSSAPAVVAPVKSAAAVAPELAKLHETFAAANNALNSCNNQALRAAVAAAVLGVVVQEAQHAIARLNETAEQ